MKSALILFSGFCALPAFADLRVSTDFEGGSATVDSIDEGRREIRIRPGGDPARGWPCWWFVRIEGIGKGEAATLVLRGSERPARNNGQDTGKPLSPSWAMPAAAAISEDGVTWRHTELGKRATDHIAYPLVGGDGPLWVAWGPPFTSRETDSLIDATSRLRPEIVKAFELARTREGRPVRGLRIAGPGSEDRPVVWVQARQHAWESGASWVARGLVEWVLGEEKEAVRLREIAEIHVIPIMDVDRVATGDGGKESDPRDHNRDWTDSPHYPEVAATQKKLLAFAGENRLAVFLDLHNPGANDRRPFFFVGPPELLPDLARSNRERFLSFAEARLDAPLSLEPAPRVTGAGYHPLWRQISGQWVNEHGNPFTMAACLETSWNTPHSTAAGYLSVGAKLGRALSDFLNSR
ncbi:MAG: zinc carboxypeptidase [Verrucomicrobiae bacterium]|nr:zinc carboxypeptidase [Verrucomicrobiae bacterium]